jgi:hypothetical protein
MSPMHLHQSDSATAVIMTRLFRHSRTLTQTRVDTHPSRVSLCFYITRNLLLKLELEQSRDPERE